MRSYFFQATPDWTDSWAAKTQAEKTTWSPDLDFEEFGFDVTRLPRLDGEALFPATILELASEEEVNQAE